MNPDDKTGFKKVLSVVMDYFGMGRTTSIVDTILFTLVIIFACFWFLPAAPPGIITITSGEKDSASYSVAEKCVRIIALDGLKLVIWPSAGLAENLKRLADPASQVVSYRSI